MYTTYLACARLVVLSEGSGGASSWTDEHDSTMCIIIITAYVHCVTEQVHEYNIVDQIILLAISLFIIIWDIFTLLLLIKNND